MRPAGVRNGPAVLAYLQPSRRARRHLRDRARRLHRPRARARARGGTGLPRVAREARLPDAAVQGCVMRATLLVELLTEELPPKSLRMLSEAFKDRLFNELRSEEHTSELQSHSE